MGYVRNISQYLEESGNRYPGKVALIDGTTQYTYRQFAEGAKALGTFLIKAGMSSCERIAVFVDRTADTLIALFGTLNAGCVYVPIDRLMPLNRMLSIFADVQPAAIVCAEKDRNTIQNLDASIPVFFFDDMMCIEADELLIAKRTRAVLDCDPAYIIYTSGSTGKPKGIAVSHRALIDYVEWIAESSGTREEDVLANQSPFYFDTFVKDVFQGVKLGCTIHILPKKMFMFPALVVDYLNEHGITAIFWSTSAIRLVARKNVLAQRPISHLRIVVMGGEALQAKDINAWRQAVPAGCRFFNDYGPTEVTVDATRFEITRDYKLGEHIPIGKACDNKQVILLGDDLKPVAPGQVGEICVRGTGLALGYYGDAEKTDDAFIQNPFNDKYPDKLYRTGDLGRQDEEGNIVFLSRKDGQFKHMGHRIEIGEVETALAAVDGIMASACLFDDKSDKIICFAELANELSDVIKDAKKRIPSYMVPNEWKVFDSLPLNANGKIDRTSLKQWYFNNEG